MPDKPTMILARRLRAARETAQLSQEEVARKLGIHRPSVSQFERGHRDVKVLELAVLARLYHLPVTHFTEGL